MPFSIIRNDITRVQADAIVNTANLEPAVGDGVDSAIYNAAGWDDLLAERRKIGRIEPGEARATNAFRLPARYIIHTVGPVWQGGQSGEQETLARCYRNSLKLADELGAGSVAFPLISTGTFGFPKDLALSTAITEIGSFLIDHDINVILVVYNKEAFVLSGKIFSDVRSYIQESDVRVRPGIDESNARVRPGIGESDMCEQSSIDESDMRERPSIDESDMHVRRSEQNLPRRMMELNRSAGSEPYQPKHPSDEAAGAIEEYQEEATLEDENFEEALPDRSAEPVLGSYREPLKESRIDFDIMPETAPEGEVDPEELEHYISGRGETFQQKLFHLIDRKNLDDCDVYKRSNIDRKLFSKIKSNPDYSPSKRTVLAFAIGMHLNLDESVDLLRSAGMAFSPGIVFDRIIEYCIAHSYYNILEINCMLFDNDQPTLGA